MGAYQPYRKAIGEVGKDPLPLNLSNLKNFNFLFLICSEIIAMQSGEMATWGILQSGGVSTGRVYYQRSYHV